jgi:hypothetical protein
MIDQEKLEIFKSFKGYFEGFEFQNKNKPKIILDEDWILLNDLIQDIFLIKKGLTSKSFEVSFLKRFHEKCPDVETQTMIYEIEKYING